MQARVSLVPGFNDSPENIEATAKFIADKLSDSIPVHLLPYHPLGEGKWKRLDRKNETAAFDTPSEQKVAECRQIFESFGLTLIVGG